MNLRPRTPQTVDPGTGSLTAPIGSEKWAQAIRLHLQGDLSRSKNPPKAVQSSIDSIRENEYWRVMNRSDGGYFESFDEFCSAAEPYGLGMPAAQVAHLIEATLAPTDIKLDKAKAIPPHPACELFPMIGEDELAKLAADIKANGLIQPIVLLRLPDERQPFGTSFKVFRHWQMLDGRNRLRACEIAGVAPHFVEWQGQGDPTAWVISTNLHRRHLTDSQRAMVAARARETVFAPAARERQVSLAGTRPNSSDLPLNCGEGKGNESADEAAAALNVSRAQVERAATILKSGTPELVAAVDRGEVAVSAAAEVSRLPADEQRAAVAAGPKAVKEAAKTQRETKKKPAKGWAELTSPSQEPHPALARQKSAPPAPMPAEPREPPPELRPVIRDSLLALGASEGDLAIVATMGPDAQRFTIAVARETHDVARAIDEAKTAARVLQACDGLSVAARHEIAAELTRGLG